MPKHIQISPSLLSADFMNIEREVSLFSESINPPEWLHIDVMDGHFVPNHTIGPPIIKALKNITDIPLDVHLMISNPEVQLDWYLDAGADLVTFHLEAMRPGAAGLEKGSSATIKEVNEAEVELAHTLIDRIHTEGTMAGLSLNPETPVGVLLPFYRSIDLILIMSVHPGFGGQSFIPQSLARIAEVRETIDALGADTLIEVDGGIDADIATLVVPAGADVLVAGNAIYGQADPVVALQQIRDSVADLASD